MPALVCPSQGWFGLLKSSLGTSSCMVIFTQGLVVLCSTMCGHPAQRNRPTSDNHRVARDAVPHAWEVAWPTASTPVPPLHQVHVRLGMWLQPPPLTRRRSVRPELAQLVSATSRWAAPRLNSSTAEWGETAPIYSWFLERPNKPIVLLADGRRHWHAPLEARGRHSQNWCSWLPPRPVAEMPDGPCHNDLHVAPCPG